MESPKDETKRPSQELLLELPRRVLQTELKLERARSEVLWRSCCAEMDSRALLFFSQLVISLLVLVFSIFEIDIFPCSPIFSCIHSQALEEPNMSQQ